MPICRKTIAAVVFAATALAFADDSYSFPSLSTPEITSPSMPSISSPQVYTSPFTPSVSKGSSSSSQYYKAPSQSAASSENTTGATAETKSESSKKIPSLTAQDIANLGDMGLLGSLSGLNNNMTAGNFYGGSVYDVDHDLMLQNLLEQIEAVKKQVDELKAEQNARSVNENDGDAQTVSVSDSDSEKNSSGDSVVDGTAIGKTSSNTSTSSVQPKILRFNVNGYNILKTCRKVYFSSPESDGNFLLTGDRKYMSDNVLRSETFYMMFTSSGVVLGKGQFDVAAAVSQDSENIYSFLYQLAQRKDLKATQTGNFVNLRTTDPDWKLDMLIDLGSAK